MALPTTALPYGLREVKLSLLSADGTTVVGSSVALPVAQTFSFSETEDFQELRGDDKLVASRGSGPIVEWDLEAGGITLDAYVILAGGTVASTGTTPNIKKTFTKLETDSRPYFKVEGRALNDNGGDTHIIVYRCKCDGSLEGSFADGEFALTSASGKGYGSLVTASLGKIYEIVHNETAVAVA